jgi:FAD/FMN-containing dehydrogenase
MIWLRSKYDYSKTLAVMANNDDGSPYGVATVYLEGQSESLPRDCAFVDTNNWPDVVELLEKEKFTDVLFYDTEIFTEIEKTGKSLKFFRKPSKDGYLLIANAKDDSRAKRRSKIHALGKKLPSSMRLIIANEDNIGEFAAVHENLIAYLSENNLEYRVPVVDQVYIPAEKRADFLSRVDELAERFSMTLPVYGSIDYNIYTVRPKLRPDDVESYKNMIAFLRAYIKLVGEMEGCICGGAPEGRFLAPFLKAEVNPAFYELNKKIKEIMDPSGVFTDGIKTEADARLIFKHFRTEYGEDLQSSY